MNNANLELLEINLKLLGRLVNVSNLLDRLDSLGTKAKTDSAVQIFGKVSLPLEIYVLDLLVTNVRKGHNACLSVGSLSKQVAYSRPHGHGVTGLWNLDAKRLLVMFRLKQRHLKKTLNHLLDKRTSCRDDCHLPAMISRQTRGYGPRIQRRCSIEPTVATQHGSSSIFPWSDRLMGINKRHGSGAE